MNKITMDEDMKKRILVNIDNIAKKEDIENRKDKIKSTHSRFIKNLLMYAACFAIVLCSITNNSFIDFFKSKKLDLKSVEVSNPTDSIEVAENKEMDVDLPNEQLESREREQSTEKNINYQNTNSSSKKVSENTKIEKSYSTSEEGDTKSSSESGQAKDVDSNLNYSNSYNDSSPLIEKANSDNAYLSDRPNDVKFNDNNLDKQITKLDNDNSLLSNRSNNVKSNNNNLDKPISNIDGAIINKTFEEKKFNSLAALKNSANFEFKVPQELPLDFKIDNISSISNKVVSINYVNGDDTIVFRTAKVTEDISGDFTKYEVEKTVNFNSMDIILKGSNEFINLAKWNKDNISYSILAKKGLGEDDILNMAKSIDIPK